MWFQVCLIGDLWASNFGFGYQSHYTVFGKWTDCQAANYRLKSKRGNKNRNREKIRGKASWIKRFSINGRRWRMRIHTFRTRIVDVISSNSHDFEEFGFISRSQWASVPLFLCESSDSALVVPRILFLASKFLVLGAHRLSPEANENVSLHKRIK